MAVTDLKCVLCGEPVAQDPRRDEPLVKDDGKGGTICGWAHARCVANALNSYGAPNAHV